MTTVVLRSRTLTDAEYAALAGFLAQQAGLVFDQSRRPALASIVGDRIAATGAADLGAYLARMSAPAGADERQRPPSTVSTSSSRSRRSRTRSSTPYAVCT